MKHLYRVTVSACGLAILATAFAPTASACGDFLTSQELAAVQRVMADATNPMNGASLEELARDERASKGGHKPSIVGMWKTQFLSVGNTNHSPSIADGTQLDFGYSQWHSDGTELYNAGSRPPATQSFCMGVWTQTGSTTFLVNHFAITYDITGVRNGLRNFIEMITLSPGGTKYSGTMVINVYDTSGNQIDHLTAQVNANRVTVDTTP